MFRQLRLCPLQHWPIKDPMVKPHQIWNYSVRCCSKSTEDFETKRDKPLGGYVYDEGIKPFTSKWRAPISERKGFFKSKFGLFGSKKFAASITKYNPLHLQYFDLKQWWKKKSVSNLKIDQQFNEERLFILGCDLAAAHFIVFRGGAIKFKDHNDWVRDDKAKGDYDTNLPNTYTPGYVLEAIDFAGKPILYDGLKNIENLSSLKWISFANCYYFDDWCLDRVSGEYGKTLEYLDISFTRVTHRGLNALYRFHMLKTLVVDDNAEDTQFYQVCMEIQKQFKGLKLEIVSRKDFIPALQQIEKNRVSNVVHHSE